MLVHCNAARDRTGEAIGAWRLRSGAAASAREMYAADVAGCAGSGMKPRPPPRPLPPLLRYAADVAECGRVPIYYSAHALEWYRLRL